VTASLNEVEAEAGAAPTDVDRWSDIIAGLSLAGLLLPEAVAYSSIANLPPQAGVIALFAGLVCYGLIGTSRYAIVAATSSSAAVLAAASASIANGDAGLRLALSIGLVIVTGVFFTAAALARIGSVSDFIAKPVLRGFAFGLAIVIILKQVATIVGVHAMHNNLALFVPELFGQMGAWNRIGGVIAIVALALLFLFARVPRLPGGLLVIGIGIAAGKWLNLQQYGVDVVGTINLQLAAPTLPNLSQAEWLRLGELGLAMVMILYAESYSSIRGFAMKHGDAVSPNRDLMAFGISNLVSGVFQGMPVGAGYSATSANDAAGARSKWAGWCAALAVLAIVLTMLPEIALTPVPVLAAVVIHAVSHTLHPAVFRSYFAWRRDRFVMVAAIVAVLLFGVLDGLLAAIAVSLIMLLRKLAESSVSVLWQLDGGHDFVNSATHPQAQSIPGIIILRPETALFFANAERILTQVRSYIAGTDEHVHTIILSLEESPDLDSSSVEALRDFFVSITALHKQLLFARLKEPAQEVLALAAIPGLLPASLCGLSVDDAVKIAQEAYSSTLT